MILNPFYWLNGEGNFENKIFMFYCHTFGYLRNLKSILLKRFPICIVWIFYRAYIIKMRKNNKSESSVV